MYGKDATNGNNAKDNDAESIAHGKNKRCSRFYVQGSTLTDKAKARTTAKAQQTATTQKITTQQTATTQRITTQQTATTQKITTQRA